MVILTLSRLIIVPCGRLRHRDGFNPHFIDEGLEAEQPTEHPRGPTARGSVPARASRQGAPPGCSGQTASGAPPPQVSAGSPSVWSQPTMLFRAPAPGEWRRSHMGMPV